MAKKQIVWGIDVGNTSLKAIRCTLSEETGKVEALACDFIEHSKGLSQPGVDVSEIIAETFQTFLSRNTTKGDRIAISVSGQNTISRFLPLPPVDPKKIPDVIRYEAKQWLPFDLNDVVFDFQPLTKPDSDDDSGFTDAMVGMFAIKKDVAAKALAPYLTRGVDVDCIQSSPIALYNFAVFDQLPPSQLAPGGDEDQQESAVILCIGTDATDVVITNGETIWTRNIPLGGNSFTKALTRELQLTSSKAEYLKRNIAASKNVDEQKRVITAMRPVFNDMVNEVNRSLEYYQTLNRQAKFQKILALGNASKLPGLRQFISQNLGYEVVKIEQFRRLVGSEVIETQLFKDNVNSFAIAYGLAVQQLGISSLRTNLIPREVLYSRIIREKKPWLLIAAASLLLAVTIQFAAVSGAYNSVFTEGFERAETRAKSVQTFSSNLRSQTESAVREFNRVSSIGQSLTSNVEGRITWLELLLAINAALPQSQPNAKVVPSNERLTSDNFARIDRVFIESVEAISVESLSSWFAALRADNRYYPDDEELESLQSASGTVISGDSQNESATVRRLTEAERFSLVVGPSDSGASSTGGGMPSMPKVIQIVGHHFHNPSDADEFEREGGEAYLRQTLLRNLKFGEVNLPPTKEEQRRNATKPVKMRELGISFPVLLHVPRVEVQTIINPDLEPLPPGVVIDTDLLALLNDGQTGGASQWGGAVPNTGRGGGVGGPGATASPPTLRQLARARGVSEPVLTVRRFDFVIQFAWEETPPSLRQERAVMGQSE